MGLLGHYYDYGTVVPVDHARAASLWRSELAGAWPRAMAGDADAQDALAEMYINSWGVTPDPANVAKAVELYRKAAEGGNVDAQREMGVYSQLGIYGLQKDYLQAAEWFRKAAERGDGFAQFQLGMIYYNGELGSKDFWQAAVWLRKAADQSADVNSILAAELLARMYLKGEGVPQDFVQAAKWYRAALENSRYSSAGDAGIELGKMYANGVGVPQDLVQAYMWLNLAATDPIYRRYGEAVEARNALAAKMTPAQIAEAQQRSTARVERR
jgi:TPR repeat protein